jgi:hypothetical protein
VQPSGAVPAVRLCMGPVPASVPETAPGLRSPLAAARGAPRRRRAGWSPADPLPPPARSAGRASTTAGSRGVWRRGRMSREEWRSGSLRSWHQVSGIRDQVPDALIPDSPLPGIHPGYQCKNLNRTHRPFCHGVFGSCALAACVVYCPGSMQTSRRGRSLI